MPQAQQPLLVIYTGGTLGMVEGPQGLTPGHDFPHRLTQALRSLPPARQASLPAFEILETPCPIDSSAATPGDWQDLAALIASRHAHYQGFVILHGTDTLAWTASSLAFQLQGIDRAVVMTGAMLPLEAPASDALGNVEDALRFASLPELQEVAVCFAGKLLRGVRARKWHTQATDAFTSPNYPWLGEVVDHHPILFSQRGLNAQQRGAPRFELPDYRALTATPAARIALWPGINARQLAAWLDDEHVGGALLEVWGGGNIPEDPDLLGVMAKATGEGKLLVAISQCPQGSIAIGAYAAGRGLADAGVLSGDDMTPEAAMSKMIHLLAQPLPTEERRRRFVTPLVGER
ncbi:L-asparaginase 1 [Litchfieldella qijiaojingensis]|uniref:L-asparaginase 1 n=1 Tax=Litchfieldella qijiaojingensis TaxID=980347 RepID=A0ABQ2YAM2_9GAMM|nr:asparaginase [Halomonas qijiaojingensis]GGX78154.1 L-asparaginase 1 [Halomonas qijiaojingensis]